MSSQASAQEDPFGEGFESDLESPEETQAPLDEEPSAQEDELETEESQSEDETETETETEAEIAAEGEAGAEGSGSLSTSSVLPGDPADLDDRDPPAASRTDAEEVRMAGSHIPRPRLMVDDAPILDGPLRTTVEGREFLQLRRQLGGVAMPDTAAALGHGLVGTSLLGLRSQPTLILLNGRRLVSAPMWGFNGVDVYDLNQLPITLISRVETTSGMAAGLYGDGAIGGAVNFVTHRDYEGVEIDLGGQVTDDFDQHEGDIALTVGAGSEKTGMNAMVSYFKREPLAATDRQWVAERLERHESILSNPASYQPLINFVEYPFVDPGCGAATRVGDAGGLELRVPLFGEPITRAGQSVIDPQLNILPVDPSVVPPIDYAARYRNNFDAARGDGDGILEANETSTYCRSDLTPFQDLVIEEERIQTYATFWHAFSDHTEGFGEIGYYRNENQNRTSPSFPVIRISPSAASVNPIVVPSDHADIPVNYYGYATAQDVPMDARVPNNFFLVGSPIALHAGPNVNERRMDTFRGVLGLRGDFEALGKGSVVESWDWELAGVYSTSEAVARVNDVLLDKLGDALSSCAGEKIDQDVSSPTLGEAIPTTIAERQEAGCFNPFYSGVTNNIAVDPLNQSSASVANDRGFITSDTQTDRSQAGFGVQDGGYICDPADPNLPCPDAFDPNQDGVYELAGTPNTQQVIDNLIGEHTTHERRSLATADLLLTGDLANFTGGGLSFGAGGQFRRETLAIDYDAAYNQRRYAFVFGAPDVEPVARNVLAGFGELRLRVADGLLEVQGAARAEHYENVGTSLSPLGGLALRPFASGALPALEWLLLRGHAGVGYRAPSLLQQYGTFSQFNSVEFRAADHFVPHLIQGNPDLDFESYTTFSGGLQWDYLGIHIAADFWMTTIDNLIAADNTQTLLADCEAQFMEISVDCPETRFVAGTETLNHLESYFDNLAEVDTNGIDGGLSYTLDTKKRGLGELGTFMIGAQGRYINSYLIKSPRALREVYRSGDTTPEFNMTDGTRDYSGLTAEYDAAGYRNLENFALPMPKLRFAVPLRWSYEGHVLGATMRYIGSYNDDSEGTIEKYGLGQTLTAPRAPGTLAVEEGETIDAWTVFDLNYGFTFGDENWQTTLALGVINLLDEPPPEAESALGYDVLVHDPRGRMIYARMTGKF